MKKILITAKHSYIGNSFAKWVEGKYDIDFISCRNDEWKNSDFSQYDVVFHVAGIAHVDAKSNLESLYYTVNRDLTMELAIKSKTAGVRQFIFMSSMIVFGESNTTNRDVIITKGTKPKPNGFYGNSKLEAERGLLSLQDNNFNIVIIRSPMIYGNGSKGNFSKLEKFAQITPLFPDIRNKRSMLHIDNLCEFIRLMIKNDEQGIFHPQNEEYICTAEMVKAIATVHNKKLRLTRFFNPFMDFLLSKINFINKLFGTFIYEKSMSEYSEKYCVHNFINSIRVMENNVTRDDILK